MIAGHYRRRHALRGLALTIIRVYSFRRLIQIFDFAIVGILFCVAVCWVLGIGNIHLYILAFLATGLGCSVHFVLSHVKASLVKEEEAKKAK